MNIFTVKRLHTNFRLYTWIIDACFILFTIPCKLQLHTGGMRQQPRRYSLVKTSVSKLISVFHQRNIQRALVIQCLMEIKSNLGHACKLVHQLGLRIYTGLELPVITWILVQLIRAWLLPTITC